MVEAVDPRKVLKDVCRVLEYQPLGIIITVYTHNTSIDDTHLYTITKENNSFNFLLDDSSLNIDSIDSFIKIISKQVIQEISISNGTDTTLLFACGEPGCMDNQRVAAMKIQRGFKSSRGYAAWKYSPQRLQQQGFFETSFGKKSKRKPVVKRMVSTSDSWKEPSCPEGQQWNQYFERCDSAFGKKNFIQEANARSRRKGTVGTFGRWCRRQNLDTDGKVSLRCINKAKRSGNTTLIRRAVYAQNIKAYAGAKRSGAKRKSSFGTCSREIKYLQKIV